MFDCIFCNIVAKQIPADFTFEDDKIAVFKDINPKASVHLLVIPKKHIISLAHTSEQDANLIAHMLLTLPKLAKAHGLQNGFKTEINTGVEGGQIINHIHFHLLGGKFL